MSMSKKIQKLELVMEKEWVNRANNPFNLSPEFYRYNGLVEKINEIIERINK